MWAFCVITMYLCGNLFVMWRMYGWLNVIHKPFNHKYVKRFILSLYGICAVIPLIAFLLPKSDIQRLLQIFSNFFFGAFVYMMMMAILFFLSFFILKFIFKKEKSFFHSRKYLYTSFLISMITVITLSIYGTIHANILYVKNYDVTIHKEAKKKDFNIVLFADLHLGYSVSYPTVKNVVEKTNKMKPDLVLIAGDIFDNDYESVHNPDKIRKELKKIKAKYGVYAVFGNHDIKEKLFAGFSMQKKENAYRDPKMEEFLTKANIKILDDESTIIADSFYLVGRLDEEKTGNGTKERKSMKELTKNQKKDLPLVVLEHEPKHLQESVDAGASLHLAGHTHDGQFFPLNITGGLFFENPYGKYQKDTMTSIVTSGVGVYGPNIRVGTNSEIVRIKLHFKKDKA